MSMVVWPFSSDATVRTAWRLHVSGDQRAFGANGCLDENEHLVVIFGVDGDGDALQYIHGLHILE